MAPTGYLDAGFHQPEAAADDVEHVLGLLVLVEQDLAGRALALGHERSQPVHRQIAVDRFSNVANQLQHLVQPPGIERQHHQLHRDDQIIMGRNRGSDQRHIEEDPEHPQRDHRLHCGGGNHEDRREKRACRSCVLCQMRRIHGSQPVFRSKSFRECAKPRARHHNPRGTPSIYGQWATICRDFHTIPVKNPGPMPPQPAVPQRRALAARPKPRPPTARLGRASLTACPGAGTLRRHARHGRFRSSFPWRGAASQCQNRFFQPCRFSLPRPPAAT